MKIHIIGICGTFMGGIALIARALGHQVSGSDSNVYPPMSTLLEQQGIDIRNGYSVEHLQPTPDLILIGNTMSRGNPVIETILREKMPFTSGPQWLSEQVLRKKHVLAVAGTHGKTTTTSLLTWILEYAGLNPGFLIGGVAENFNLSARLSESDYFVIEADEYDTAFFDKRSKFVHYFPDTLILNNLEFDHADIFPDLEAIKTQFRHLLRVVPDNGLVLQHATDENIKDVMGTASQTRTQTFSAVHGDWQLFEPNVDYSSFQVSYENEVCARIQWSLIGRHNAENALAAIAAAAHVGIDADTSAKALTSFRNVKRRLQLLACVNDIHIYDDFAHHPTAIAATLDALRDKVGNRTIHAVLEPRSNTMKAGVHADTLVPSMQSADEVYLFQSKDVQWDIAASIRAGNASRRVFNSTDNIIEALVEKCQPGDHILIMSNGGFENIHARLIERLKTE